MKRFLTALLFVVASTTLSHADYRLIVPQEPGGGTSVWANVMSKYLAKFIGEPVIVEHIPGAFDVPGFNKWHNELRKDPKTIMVAHGGNAESFLTEKVDYNYSLYDPISAVNLNVAVDKRTDFNLDKDKVKFGASSGRRPDVMAMTMLVCGPQKTIDDYIKCYKDKVVYIPSMSPAEGRLAAQRGELNVVRETFVSQKKFIDPLIEKKEFEIWFNHGLLDLKTGKIVPDKNFAGPTFEEAYKAKWGKEPSGDFYEAYVLAKNYRDVLQKSLWVDKGNPNTEKLREAVRQMLKDPEALADIIKDSGDYQWFVGEDVTKAYKIINKQLSEKSLKTLVKFNVEGIGINSVYKPELLK